jgi:cytoskeletal protein RodZ
MFIKQKPEKMEINEIENVQKTAAESEKNAAENNSTELFVEKTTTGESIEVEKSSLNSLKLKFTGSSWIEIKDGKEFRMSKRAGNAITLKQLLKGANNGYCRKT